MNSNCSNLLYLRNLQEQVKKAFCYQKLFWPFTVWINCSSDHKIFANSRPSASNFKSFSRSIEQFFLIVGQNNFGKKIPFFLKSRLHDHMTFIFRPLFVKLSFLIIIQSDLILMGHEKKLFFEANVPSSHFWILCTLGLNELWRSILIYFDLVKYEEFIFMMINSWKNERKMLWKRRCIKKRLLRQKLFHLKEFLNEKIEVGHPSTILYQNFILKFLSVFRIMTTHLSCIYLAPNFYFKNVVCFFTTFFDHYLLGK